MHRPRYLSGDPAWELAWGISWYAIRRGDVVWVQHSGDIHGFSSNVCFDREHRVGAIALVNTMVSAGELSMQLAAIGREAVAALPRTDRAAVADAGAVSRPARVLRR